MILFPFGLETEPLAAPTLFSIGPLSITNAMLFMVFTAAFTVGFLYAAAKASQLYPKSRFAYYIELLVDALLEAAVGTFGDRELARKYLPLLATLFTFILVGNLSGSGLLPGVGTITAQTGNTQTALLRPFTTDLNATLAMAIFTIGLVQFSALRQLGLKKHLRHYFAAPLYNPMNIFIGLNEVFGELLRVVTLSMRLFGVIYAGEVLISAVGQIAGNFGWLATVPTVLLEIFFSIIQAYVFMMLSATYLSVAVGGSEDHKEHKAATVN
jgi:F-type H+-transporting ATPase subunit a